MGAFLYSWSSSVFAYSFCLHLDTMSSDSEKPEINNADLRKIQTAESVLLPIPRDTFEKLYLSPKHPATSSSLSKKFGNPTPISLLGFLLAATPNAMIFMGWRGAGGHGGAIM
jgi:hypothetical protein